MSEYKPKFCKDIPQEKIEYVANFLEQTRKREAELEHKKLRYGGLERAEEYELEMCKFDIKRAVEFLK